VKDDWNITFSENQCLSLEMTKQFVKNNSPSLPTIPNLIFRVKQGAKNKMDYKLLEHSYK
jgi:hypothetical protein